MCQQGTNAFTLLDLAAGDGTVAGIGHRLGDVAEEDRNRRCMERKKMGDCRTAKNLLQNRGSTASHLLGVEDPAIDATVFGEGTWASPHAIHCGETPIRENDRRLCVAANPRFWRGESSAWFRM